MKYINFKRLFIIAFALVIISGCDSDESDVPNNEDVFLSKLHGSWTLNQGTVTRDGRDVTKNFKNFTISFSNESFNVMNSVPPLWPANGRYTLEPGNGELFNVRREDGLLITVTHLTESQLTFNLHFVSTGGRAHSVSGEFEFKLTR